MLFRFSIRHPIWVTITAILVTSMVAPGVIHLKIRTDGHALVPPASAEIFQDQLIRDEFGIEDPIVVLIRSSDPRGIFNPHTLRLVQEFTTEFQKLDTISHGNLTSLAIERGDRVRPGTLIFRRFLEPPPRSGEALDRLRDDLRAIELYSGVLVSYDEKATAVLVGVPEAADRAEMYRTIRGIVASKGNLPEQIDVIGAPVAEALLGTHLLEDLGVPSLVLGDRLDGKTSASSWTLPKSLDEFRAMIGQRIGLVPIALALMAFVFLLSFRSVVAAFLPLMEVGACLVFVFGLMGWLDVPVYLTIAVLPVVLTAIGVADEIHIFARYREQLRAQPERPANDVLHETMAEMWVPVMKTSVTTAIGFLSFALSPIDPVRAFGVFTAIGIVFCMVWSLTVIPALLAMIPASWLTRRPEGGPVAESPPTLFGRLGALVLRLRGGVVVIALLVMVIAPFGAGRVVVQDSWIDGFAERSTFHRATTYFNEQFLGVHTLLLRVDAGQVDPLMGSLDVSGLDHHFIRIPVAGIDDPDALVGQALYLRREGLPGGVKVKLAHPMPVYTWKSRVEEVTREGDQLILATHRKNGSPKIALNLRRGERAWYRIRPEWFMRPATIQHVEKLEAFIESHTEEAVGGVLGTADYLATTEFMIRGRKEGSRAIPGRWERMEWVWGQYRKVRGEHRWRQAVTEDYTRGLISVFLKNANFVGTKRLMEEIRAYEEVHLKPHGISLDFAGDVAVSQTLIDAIVSTQVISLLGSLIGIFLVTAFLGGSLAWGLLCVLPCALVVLTNFAVMGVTGMPLGVATSMFSGMTLGIGVDYAIHLMERYRRAQTRGLDIDAALTDAVRATGPAIFIDGLAVALGFGILTLSQVPPNARLGGLVVLSIAGCLVATLILLPALIRVLQLRPRGVSSVSTA